MPTNMKVLVTGATSGIGLSTAIHLAEHGYTVFGAGRSDAKLDAMVQQAKDAGVDIIPVQLDVTDEHSIASARDFIVDHTAGYGLDVLINNAGYGQAGAIEELPIHLLRQQFETNVIGLVAVSQAFIPFMRSRHTGHIINISSVLGKVTVPLMSAYAATKHAVEALSNGMRIELAPAGIHVVIVAPGSIQSNFGATVTESVQSWVSETSPYYTKYRRWRDMNMMNGAGRSPLLIAEAVRAAIESPQPKPRYSITIESKVMPAVVALLPKRLLDAAIRRVMM